MSKEGLVAAITVAIVVVVAIGLAWLTVKYGVQFSGGKQ